jgi:HEAT repeat protein
LGSSAAKAVPTLVAALPRLRAGEEIPWRGVIARIDPAHREGVPALIQLLATPDEADRKAVVSALMDAGQPAIPTLLAGLDHPEEIVRLEVVRSLFFQRNRDEVAVALERRLARETSEGVAAAIKFALKDRVTDEDSANTLLPAPAAPAAPAPTPSLEPREAKE